MQDNNVLPPRPWIKNLYILHIHYQLPDILAIYGMLELAAHLHPLGQVHQLFILQIIAHPLGDALERLGSDVLAYDDVPGCANHLQTSPERLRHESQTRGQRHPPSAWRGRYLDQNICLSP